MRNFIVRTISGIVFLGIMIWCLLGGIIPFACLMLFLMVGMMLEFYKLTLKKGLWLQKIIGILAGIILLLEFFKSAYFGYVAFDYWVVGGGIALFLLWIILLIQQLYRKSVAPFAVIAYTLLGFMYIAVPLSIISFFALSYKNWQYDGGVLLALFIILWSSDVGAYIFGILFGQNGKHKLFPSISPKKSWEGFCGGLLMATGSGFALHYLGILAIEWYHSIAISLLISVFGMFGDIIESMLKRNAGVKDSGKIMPGHGGFLDRFDAALLALPIACIYIYVCRIYF